MMSKDYPPYLDYPKPYKPMTNGDRIRSMTDEELAEFLCGVYDEEETDKFICGTIIPNYYEEAICDWLKQPAESEG
jgi:hypothetical protein